MHGELSCWHQDESLDLVERRVHPLNQWDGVSGGLPCTVLGTGDDVAALQSDGDGLLLDGGRSFVAHLINAELELLAEAEIRELQSLGVSDILSLKTSVLRWGQC